MCTRNGLVDMRAGTYIVTLYLGCVLVLLGCEFDSEGLTDELRLARPVLWRVHVQALKKAAVLVTELGQAI